MEEILKRGPGRPPKQEVESVTADATDEAALARRQKYLKERYNPLGQKLVLPPPRPGFRNKIVNDWPGRIADHFNRGWNHIKDALGKPIVFIVGTAEGGGPLHGYGMEAPEEWALEDQRKAEAESNSRMEAIKRSSAPANTEARDSDKFYAGKEGSSIRRDR